MPLSRARKIEYFDKMEDCLTTYNKVFVVSVDNVGSAQMQTIRKTLRGEAEVLMGKNTLMRKVLQGFLADHPNHPYNILYPRIRGNIGFIFTNGNLGAIKDILVENRVPAPARVGAIAPVDVIVPAGPTGCDPGQTSFFQTLQIATKISRGQIEITTPVPLITKGDKVGNSEAVLLQKLNINPFTYGLEIICIYDNGSIFDASVLDLTEDVLAQKFGVALRKVAAISLEVGYPTQASIPHSIANAFKKLVAIAVECDDFSFTEAEPYKAYLADPSAFASSSSGGSSGGATEVVQEEEEEEEEEMDLGGGMDMFGDDGGY